MEINWLESAATQWQERARQGRLPHAVMLAGPIGVGKRALAAWLAAHSLDLPAGRGLPAYPCEPPEHADLHWIRPEDDKATIGIEQVRDLVAEFSLTSYTGRGKVAVLEPANAMTANAANSLLKTLEEPPGHALLILVADRHGQLPATIFSRCQRIDIRPPAAADGLAWLDRLRPGVSWADALAAAGNAPLAAIAALDDLETHSVMRRDLAEVGGGRMSPLEAAARWARQDAAFVLNWLARQVQSAIISLAVGRSGPGAAAIDDSVLSRMDMRNLFCYLDTINRLRGQPGGSFNVQLALETLLIDWAEGLANTRKDAT